ncbi:TonB family protein [Bradyrhizobium manausense]|uniref:energy transducer TonB n=1 Tax=Bradyrhizobium manausense TaxID=989370 RepID=UPI001BA7E614|nr:energy transducer TonB [Bradyrhizobium manausense]MBR1087501.1 TonB family protein [Bradyrhizobium manausense]
MAPAVGLLALSLPSWAQDAGKAPPDDDLPPPPAIGKPLAEPSHRSPDQPPPLNLGGSDNPAQSDAPRSRGNRWGAYASAVQSALEAGMKANARTRGKSFEVRCEIWVDPKGHVTRVELAKPSGDADIDAALRNEVLPRLALPAPASDMPMPVKGHITARLQQ